MSAIKPVIRKKDAKPKLKVKVKIEAHHCKQWLSNPLLNPITGHTIKHGLGKYNEFVKTCKSFGFAVDKMLKQTDVGIVPEFNNSIKYQIRSCPYTYKLPEKDVVTPRRRTIYSLNDNKEKLSYIYKNMEICEAPAQLDLSKKYFQNRNVPELNLFYYMFRILNYMYSSVIHYEIMALYINNGTLCLKPIYINHHGNAHISRLDTIGLLIENVRKNKSPRCMFTIVGDVQDSHAVTLVFFLPEWHNFKKTVHVALIDPNMSFSDKKVEKHVRDYFTSTKLNTVFTSSVGIGGYQTANARIHRSHLDYYGYCTIYTCFIMETVARYIHDTTVELTKAGDIHNALRTTLVPADADYYAWHKLIIDYAFTRTVQAYAFSNSFGNVAQQTLKKLYIDPYIDSISLPEVQRNLLQYLGTRKDEFLMYI